MPILADQHVHTHHSGDSKAPMEDVIRQAIACGLTDLCFTEHLDFDYPAGNDPEVTESTFLLDSEAYYREYCTMRDAYADRIRLHFGLELGMQPQVAEENRQFVRSHPFDFIIGSIHVIKRRDPYYPSFYEGITDEEAMRLLLAETLENIRVFDDFDVLGHLDVILRYMPGGRKTMDMTPFADALDEILKLLISRGQGLDLNTQPIWKRDCPEMNPSRQILARYRALGGSIITFGADAHRPPCVAGGFDRGEAIAKEMGFTGYYVFENRKGRFVEF